MGWQNEVRLYGSLDELHVIISEACIQAELARNSSLCKPTETKQLFEKLVQTLLHLCQFHRDAHSLASTVLDHRIAELLITVIGRK